MRILLVEDDRIISKNIQTIFTKRGFAVDHAETINDAYTKTTNNEYDCVVLDRGLPDGDGIDLIKKIHDDEINVPILVLTARSENEDIIEGLNNGSDDYLVKPFDMNVLVARVKALTRRSDKLPTKPIIKIDDLEINTNSTEVKRNGKIISLSPREYALIEYLGLNQGKVIDRLTLLSHVWDENTDLFSNTVDVHIKYLRNKIDKGSVKKLIKTARGKGYMIC